MTSSHYHHHQHQHPHPRHFLLGISWTVVLVVIIVTTLPRTTMGFVPPMTSLISHSTSSLSSSLSSSSSTSTTLHASSSNNNNNNNNNKSSSFELTELKLNLRSMAEQKMSTANQIQEEKRIEIETYVRNVIRQTMSSTATTTSSSSSSSLAQSLTSQLPKSSWLLNFSTQSLTNQALPPGAVATLNFLESNNNIGQSSSTLSSSSSMQRVNYCLEFTKTFGLSKLTAESTYTIDPNTGWLTYAYENITTDAMGLSGISIPFVGGMLRGRTTVIQTVYFDNELWIEQGQDELGMWFQVYTRLDDDTDDDWQQS